MIVNKDNNPQDVFDTHFALRCPHCGIHSNITAISIPRYEYLFRFRPELVGVVYRCDSCNGPVFLRFQIEKYDFGNYRVVIHDKFQQVERTEETFDFNYLPDGVCADFRECLSCYSNLCLNAFASMCRRTVQSVCTDMGARGADRVLRQLKDLKEMAEIDDETFDILKQIVVDGHDGAHPHLPSLTQERAAVLLELMKDVLYQIYVRKGKLQEAMTMRQGSISEARPTTSDR